MKIEKDVEASESLALLARTQVSFRSRVGHLALLLLTTGFSVALVSLLLTEENLPVRAAAGLLASLAINLVWAIYAAWVLAVRRTMLFNHRVVAGRIAVAATTLFALGSVALGVMTGATAAYLAAGLGLGLVAVAAVLLGRARRDFSELQLRRSQLEARLLEMAQ
jgi:hypothetical protein